MKTPQKYLLVQIALALAVLVCSPRLIQILASTDIIRNEHIGWDDYAVQLTFSFMFATIILHLNNNQSLAIWKRLLASFLIYLICTFLFILLHIGILNFTEPQRAIKASYLFRNLFIMIISVLVTNFLNANRQKQELTLQNKSLEAENLKAQLNSLQQQLNPHFLFNSLNSLQSLMRENVEKSQIFVQNLSTVLRYSLDFQKRELVSIYQELQLLEAYLYLLKVRFGDKLTLKFERIEFANGSVPPLALQLLIENAVNHNEISTQKPMTIRIIYNSESSTLSVINKYNPKKQSISKSGLGLHNLNNRYELLSKKNIEITQDECEFKVVIPVL
ncbi:MAG: sensor histidine kinase [Leadbetterella sp.]